MEKIALTIPGGGARAGYQAGVLRAISDICKFKESPFQIISGVSAGGITGMWLASGASDFDQCTAMMWDTWKHLSVNDVYKTDPMTIAKIGAKWLRNLSLGNWFSKNRISYLLDTSPLAKLLKDKINFDEIQKNLDSGLLYGLALTATDYELGTAVTFFTGDKTIEPWAHTLASGRRDRIGIDHVMATCAIPIFFPPVNIGGRDYGDGGIGLKSPLSPAIHMGANKILVIGVQNPRGVKPGQTVPKHPATLGDVAGTLLNSLFLNSLDTDIERAEKINHAVSIFTPEQLKKDMGGLHKISILLIHPSRDLSCVGAKEFGHFPFAIRHMLKGLGVTNEKGWDLLSYLAFDQMYSTALLNLGYDDTMRIKKDVLNFFTQQAIRSA